MTIPTEPIGSIPGPLSLIAGVARDGFEDPNLRVLGTALAANHLGVA